MSDVMVNDQGRRENCLPATPVEITGLNSTSVTAGVVFERKLLDAAGGALVL